MATEVEQKVLWFSRRVVRGDQWHTVASLCELVGVDMAHQATVKRVLSSFQRVHPRGSKRKVNGILKSFRVGYQFGIDSVVQALDQRHYPFGQEMVYTPAESARVAVYRQSLAHYRDVLAQNGWDVAWLATLTDAALLWEMICSDRRAGLYLLKQPPPDAFLGKCTPVVQIPGYHVYGGVIAVNDVCELYSIQGKSFKEESNMVVDDLVSALDRLCTMLDGSQRDELKRLVKQYIDSHGRCSDCVCSMRQLLLGAKQ